MIAIGRGTASNPIFLELKQRIQIESGYLLDTSPKTMSSYTESPNEEVPKKI
jgi:hypothetical protein